MFFIKAIFFVEFASVHDRHIPSLASLWLALVEILTKYVFILNSTNAAEYSLLF